MDVQCVHHAVRAARARCVACADALCADCRVRVDGRNWCRPCVPSDLLNRMPGRRSPTTAAVLSTIPGFGQMYAGRGWRGIVFLAATALLAARQDALPSPIPLFLWVFNLFDAYALAVERNARLAGRDVSRDDHRQRRFFGLFAGAVALFATARMTLAPQLDPNLLWPAGLVLYATFLATGRGDREAKLERKAPDVQHA